MIPTLNTTDLERPRTQTELRAWVDDLHRKFGQTQEGKRAVRLNRGDLVKRFKEEIWPLALFADAFYNGRGDVLFKPVIGNQSYDALILEASAHKVLHHLQITQSFDGYQNYLRMLHLVEHGRAPVTSAMLQRDKASGRVPETWPEAVPHDQVLARTFVAIHEAVRRKSQMRYESDTSLIVEFEDNHIHSESDRSALDSFARSTVVPAAAHVAALYLVSDRERLAFKYESGAAAQQPIGADRLSRPLNLSVDMTSAVK
ncbi:MAG: hypothetical protein HY726_02000 [Candidatus Rokubacteria bacterium]|nr:hypothetical protein [Candidatus Rokubacteria bacterium]